MADTTLYPTADARVAEVSPDSNYGTLTYWTVRTRTVESNMRTFLKFDISGLPAGAVISLAKLRSRCYSINNLVAGVTDVQARRVADDSWVETEITWNNQPDYGDVEDTKVPAVGWVEWDVTSWVQNEWAGDKTVSICLRCVQEDYDGTLRDSNYYSKEYDGLDPELYIEYTPIPIHHKVTVAEKLGMVDAVAKKKAMYVAVAEKLGLKDAVAKKAAYKQTVAEKLGMLDAVKKAKGIHVTVAEKLGLVDDYFKRVTAGRLPDNPDNIGSRGSPVYKDMPDYMGAVYVNTKNTWQDAENLDELHGYKSYMWIPEETFKVKLMKLHVYAEKFRAYSKAAKEATPSHKHDVKIDTATSTSVKPDHTHSVTGVTSSGGGVHRHRMFRYMAAAETLERYKYYCRDSEAAERAIIMEVDSDRDLYSYDAAPTHTHDVSGQTAEAGGASHAHTVDYKTKTSEEGAGIHGHEIEYGIWEDEEIAGRTLSAILYDPKGNPLMEWDPLTTGEMDVILDLTEYFKDLKYGMYRLELTASGRIRARLVYYELGIMFAV